MAQCTSTPHLLAWKQGRQNSDSGVPGGYIVYMVMGVVPGERIVNVFRELGREERGEFRRGFKEAWLYVFFFPVWACVRVKAGDT